MSFEYTAREMLQNYGIVPSSIETILSTYREELYIALEKLFPNDNASAGDVLACLYGGIE
jgi:hypothetical protein